MRSPRRALRLPRQAARDRVKAQTRGEEAVTTLQRHWPEYLIEAVGLGLFMISACLFAALLEHREIELMSLPVIQIDRCGFRNFGNGLKEQHAFRHLDPARGDTVADCQKYLDDVRNIGVLGQAKLFGCEQRFEA